MRPRRRSRLLVRRVQKVSRLLGGDGQAEPVLWPLAGDRLQERATFGAAERQPQFVDEQQAPLLVAMDVVSADLRPDERLDQVHIARDLAPDLFGARDPSLPQAVS
jgi:hypothetical protein